MTGTNSKALYTFKPYEIYVREDGKGYCVLNADTGVFELEQEYALGQAIAFASRSSDFLIQVEEELKEEPVINVYAANSIKAH